VWPGAGSVPQVRDLSHLLPQQGQRWFDPRCPEGKLVSSSVRGQALALTESHPLSETHGEFEMQEMNSFELRDWFAGQALAGMLSNPQCPQQVSGEPFDQYAAKMTDSAYRFAEAMMRQSNRLKKETTAAW
jgi:hypothetical protein